MSNPERKVPVYKTENSIIDQEFSSIRERFDNEMKRMEQEMDRFRNEISDRERDFFGKSISDSFNQSSRTTTTSNYVTSSSRNDQNSGHSNLVQRQTSNQLNSWLDDINSPLVQDSNDGKQLKLRFDVTQYLPEEIVVKTVDNRLQVQAKHEEKSENRSVFRKYEREFLLPQGVNPELIRSSLSKDGVLTVECPLPAIENEQRIPIAHR